MCHTVKRLLYKEGQLPSGFTLEMITLTVSNCCGFKTIIQKNI